MDDACGGGMNLGDYDGSNFMFHDELENGIYHELSKNPKTTVELINMFQGKTKYDVLVTLLNMEANGRIFKAGERYHAVTGDGGASMD